MKFTSIVAAWSFSVFSMPGACADVVFNVNTTADLVDNNVGDGLCRTDANNCSLRAAIMQANVLSAPGAKIVSLPPGIFLLTRVRNDLNGEDNGDLYLAAPPAPDPNQQTRIRDAQAAPNSASVELAYIVIRGAGAGISIIDANYLDGALRVEYPRQARFESLTIRHGRRLGDNGGGIHNAGSLTLIECAIEQNSATIDGGGLFSSGALSIARSTISSNVAGRNGGGMSVDGSTLVRDSSLHSNIANHHGGAIENAERLDVVNGTISYNAAGTNGGGVYSSAEAILRSTTVIGNDADHDRDQNGGIGGGIYAEPGSLFGVINALVAGNTIRDAPLYNDCNGVLNSSGRNLFFTLSGDGIGCSFIGTSAGLVSLNTLGPLQDNGGPTWTHALLAGNEAINATLAGDGCTDQSGGLLTADQRGAARVVGPRCDVGAFEFGANVVPIFKSGFE
jgi:CSLREA domain-containing protein